MCGIAGIIDSRDSRESLQMRIKHMKVALQHRGPDDEGSYFDADSPVVLGHRRLAIIDPEHGKQPMSTQDGQITVIFNGAIYNYLELRRELISRGHPIRSFSDTEVLLYAYREWGEKCVERFHGMFAFAIWDRNKQILFCARDRIGIKPFYYYFDGQCLVFASEIKAILAAGGIKPAVETEALQDYITFQMSLGEKTLFKNIKKLEAGYQLIAKPRFGSVEINIQQYWDIAFSIDENHDEAYFVDHLASLLEDSIHQHLRSDVPLGAHLSGGLDSSAIVCLAAPILKGVSFKTFTGAFREGPQFDETHYAKLIAEFSGAEYQEVYVPGDELATTLPKLMYCMDEPTAGPGLIPQYYVSKLAAQHVKVVLGGQGGDEIYLGYARYLVAYLEKCLYAGIYQTASSDPYAISLETIAQSLPLLQTYKPMLQHFWREELFAADDRRYFRLVDRSEGMRDLFKPDVFSGYSSFESFKQIFNRPDSSSLLNKMTYFDTKASLPALLHVEDRVSMAVSLESRVPLLDHRLVEFMATIPPNIKFSNGRAKHLFKTALQNILPKPILERKDKMGFPVPLNQWLQGHSKEFVADILFSQRTSQRGLYNIQQIENIYKNEHQFSRVIWGLLCLELWHRIYIDGEYRDFSV